MDWSAAYLMGAGITLAFLIYGAALNRQVPPIGFLTLAMWLWPLFWIWVLALLLIDWGLE